MVILSLQRRICARMKHLRARETLGYDYQKSECLLYRQAHLQISFLTLEGVLKKSIHLEIGLPHLLFI